MNLRTAPTILTVAVVFVLLVPTVAIFGTMGSPTDGLFDGEPSVEMQAHDGPNGEYVAAAEDGQLEIDFSDPGLNSEAFTGVERVFDLINTDTTNVTVWVTHDGDDQVTLYEDATGAPLESEDSGVVLSPGETVTVSIDVDSTDAVAGDQLLSTVTLHANYDAAVPDFGVEIDDIPESVSEGETVTAETTVTNDGEAGGETTVEFLVDGEVVDSRTLSLEPGESQAVEFEYTAGGDDATVSIRTGDSSIERTVSVVTSGGGSGGGGGGSGGGTDASETGDGEEETEGEGEGEDTQEDTAPEETATDEDAGVEVEFEGDETEETEGDTSEDDSGDDQPSMTVREMDASELDSEDTDRPPQAVINSETGGTSEGADAEAFDTMTLVDEPTELSSERSTIGSAEAVTSRDRISRIVDIQVPSDRANRPGTVRMRVDRDRLGDVDGESTMIGHRTEDGGWELLETRVVDQTEESIVVEARTPGFSPFAVFSPPSVTYEWTLPNGTVLEGQRIDPTFEEPGFYDVQLTVTDALGRQSTTTHRILANDVPEATVEVVDREGDEVTLAANVTDEFGETEVTWTFPDGTEKTGEEITHTLEEGEHEISLHVVDEYGAESESEHTVAVGPPGAAARMETDAVADALGMDLGVIVQLGLLSTIGLALAVGYRRFPWGMFAPNRRRGPEITVDGSPDVDADAGRITLEEFAVENATELDTVRIEITDDSDRNLIRKRLDLSGMTSYTTSRETVTVPPGIDIDPEESYTIRIKATDAGGHSAERDLSGIAADADDGSGANSVE
ncbi:PKD domain-containing protein [Natronomonas sp. F2-12]|uniref:PKD domain-containing protein n=1 Tax=Natronomonas aquatica TaxID=2841590 RepID=A0A9R1D6W6_9EURY|nr:PKD domain-containing protein [Natronomonas aquatica]MCQ4333682.1 PKD domain-containing protein [Natronomonas aquatica]